MVLIPHGLGDRTLSIHVVRPDHSPLMMTNSGRLSPEHERRVEPVEAARRRRPTQRGCVGPERTISCPTLARSIPALTFSILCLLLRHSQQRSLTTEHSITSVVASRALHRTAIASISPIAAPRPPPPPRRVCSVRRASVRAYSPFPSRRRSRPPWLPPRRTRHRLAHARVASGYLC